MRGLSELRVVGSQDVAAIARGLADTARLSDLRASQAYSDIELLEGPGGQVGPSSGAGDQPSSQAQNSTSSTHSYSMPGHIRLIPVGGRADVNDSFSECRSSKEGFATVAAMGMRIIAPTESEKKTAAKSGTAASGQGNRWYFEVQSNEPSTFQVGWATERSFDRVSEYDAPSD